MSISVLGVSDLGRVTGLRTDDPAGLLRSSGDGAASHILLLTPQHAAYDAREQAHVLLAARPDLRVCVLPLPHHALTLALVADTVLQSLGDRPERVDPSAVWQLVRQSAARSRSLVWHPRLADVANHARTPGQLLADLGRARGWFTEQPSGAVTPGRLGPRTPPFATVLHQGEAPRLLRTQLGTVRGVPVMVEVEPAPYRGRRSVEVTVLVPPALPAVPMPPCAGCGAGLVACQCPWCGQGPVRDPEHADDVPAGPAPRRAVELVPAATSRDEVA